MFQLFQTSDILKVKYNSRMAAASDNCDVVFERKNGLHLIQPQSLTWKVQMTMVIICDYAEIALQKHIRSFLQYVL